MTSMRTTHPMRASFDDFAADAGLRLQRALVAHYGVDIGVEVTADAMAYAWEHWDELRLMENPVGYLYRVGQSAARRYRRWADKANLPPERSDNPPGDQNDLGAALAELPDRQRTVVLLVHGHGFTYEEAAEVLGTSHASVRNNLHRAMKRLRRLLEEHDDS